MMLKKPASIVLASFRPSTWTPRLTARRRAQTCCSYSWHRESRGYASGSSLAAALLNGLFEHPAGHSPVALDVQDIE